MKRLTGLKDFLYRIYMVLSSKIGVFILLALIVALSSAVLYNYAEYNVAANELCGVCHSMDPFIEGLKGTPHGDFNCHVCHELTLESLQTSLVGFIVSNPPPSEIIDKFSPKISMYEECISCHTLSVISKMKIHQAHISIVTKFDSCDICHNPHALNEINTQCLDCHNLDAAVETHSKFHILATSELDKGNDEICLRCHSTEATWQVPVCPESILGLLRGYQCFDCHQPPLHNPNILEKSCTDCHAK